MGHESSKSVESSPPPDSTVVKGSRRSRLKQRLKGSRRSRFEQRLHLYSESRRRRLSGTSGSSTLSKLPSAEDFAGIALLTLIRAEMNFKDKWLACVSFGEQTFRTEVSDHTDKPVWNSEKKLLLENSGPCVARISVFETNKLSRNNLIGYRELDLFDFLAQDSEPECEVFDLLHPLSPGIVAGNISLSCCIEDPVETQKSFARRILAIVAYNEDGTLSLLEFSKLMEAFGNKVAAAKIEELFKAADKNGDGVVSMDELADLITHRQEKEPLINCCPVCGETLEDYDMLNNMIHMTLCFDEGTGNQVMTGGFLTDKQAAYG